MQQHNIHPKHKLKKKRRVGRGGKKGTYSGKGMKGQKSRAGRTSQPMIREIIKRYPKLRGYRFNPKLVQTRTVNLSVLEKNFESGGKVSPEILLKKRIISKIRGRAPEVKILGKGELSKKLIIEDCSMSKGVREKVEKADGVIFKSKAQMSNVKSNPND